MVRPPETSLRDLLRERGPLYERWADLRVDAGGPSAYAVADAVLRALGERAESAGSAPDEAAPPR